MGRSYPPILVGAVIQYVDDVSGQLVAELDNGKFVRIHIGSLASETTMHSYSYSIYDHQTKKAVYYEGVHGDPDKDIIVPQ